MKISTLFFAAGFSRLLVWNAHHTNYNSIESRRDQDEHSPPVSRDSKVVDKISSEFGSFSGGDSNAVVTGHKKRNLDYANEPAPSTTTGAANTETTIINPPTGKNGAWQCVYFTGVSEAATRRNGHDSTDAAPAAVGAHGGTNYDDYRKHGDGNSYNNLQANFRRYFGHA